MKKFSIFAAQLAAMAAVVMSANAEPLRIEITPAVQTIQIDKRQHYCLNEAMYWEGRNQSPEEMAAIGFTIMNRVAHADFPDTICEVTHQGPRDGSPITLHKCQFSYYCDGKSDAPPRINAKEMEAWLWADVLAEAILLGEIDDSTHGSTHYHADYVDPSWNEVYQLVAIHGVHLFYVH